MSNLEKLLESLRKQSEFSGKFSGAFGMNNSLNQLSEQLKKSTIHQFTGLDSLTKMSRDITGKFALQHFGITNSLAALAEKQSAIGKFSFPGLESSFAKLAQQNTFVSEKLATAFKSQVDLSNTLTALAKSINPPINQFNVLNTAIQGLSYNYLNKIAKSSTWNDIEILEDVNEKLTTIAGDVDTNAVNDSDHALENLKKSIIAELTPLIQKSKSERARVFIMDLIAIIGFILAIYDFNNSGTDLSNRKVLEIASHEISQLKKDIELRLEDHLKSLQKTRLAITNVNLRYSDKKNSQIIGIVKKGQQVLVIEIRHKWLLVTYLDDETKRPMSGFVYKKYFKFDD